MEMSNDENGAGGDALVTQDIRIAGMSCDHCAGTVEKALRGQEGVKEARVDRLAGTATVTFDQRKTNLADLRDAILKSGYQPVAMGTGGRQGPRGRFKRP